MDTIDGMRSFVAVVSAGSFKRGAARIGISPALISKYIGQLEERLGVRLLNRTTRSLALTEVGQAYFERCVRLIDEFDELEAAIQDKQAAPRGQLRISAPTTFGETFMAQAIIAFMEEAPEIAVDMVLSDRFVSIVDEGYDLAIRMGDLPDSSLIARRLTETRFMVYASRDYLKKHGEPRIPEELEQHECVIDTNMRNPVQWPFKVDGKRANVRVNGRIKVNSARAVREMVLADKGIGITPAFIVRPDLNEGTVRCLLEDFEAVRLGVYAVYPHNRHLAVKVRTFVDYLVKYFARCDDLV